MKWKVSNGLDDGLGFLVFEEGDRGALVASFEDKAKAASAVADHNLCERFADPEVAVALLMQLAGAAARGELVENVAKRFLALESLQPPGDAT